MIYEFRWWRWSDPRELMRANGSRLEVAARRGRDIMQWRIHAHDDPAKAAEISAILMAHGDFFGSPVVMDPDGAFVPFGEEPTP